MIVYERLWQTMRRRGISQYRLIREYGVSSGQLDRLRKNQGVSTYTLDQLCRILDCRLEGRRLRDHKQYTMKKPGRFPRCGGTGRVFSKRVRSLPSTIRISPLCPPGPAAGQSRAGPGGGRAPPCLRRGLPARAG